MIGKVRPARERDDNGAAAVEFAILVPLLLIVVFGIIAFGLVLFSQISATHAARETVRQIAVNNPNVDTCAEVETLIENKAGFAPTDVEVTTDGARGPGDQVTLTFVVPTSDGAVGALRGVTSFFPGGTVILPSEFTVSADARVEEAGPIVTGDCP
jgi:Flp pilus assembly protein TadG